MFLKDFLKSAYLYLGAKIHWDIVYMGIFKWQNNVNILFQTELCLNYVT